jgi:RND superfamily putative drug exporter
MVFASFGKYRNSGPAIAFCLAVSLVATLTLAPALLRAFGPNVFWPFRLRAARRNEAESTAEASGTRGELSAALAPAQPSRRGVGEDASLTQRVWRWIARQITAHPATILATSVVVLIPLAWEGLSVPISYDLINELQSDRASVVGTRMFRQHFPAGETGPIGIVAYGADARFDTTEGEHEIARLTKLLYDLDGVTSVRSIAEPLGNAPGKFNPFSGAGIRKLMALSNRRSEEIYISQAPGLEGKVARLDVVAEFDPFSPAAMSLLNTIEQRPSSGWWSSSCWPRSSPSCGGPSSVAISSCRCCSATSSPSA